MRLSYRLSLSFLAVAALAALLSFALVQRSSEALFRSFMFSGDSAKAAVYADLLGEYYRTEGSWVGAQRFLEDFPRLFSDVGDAVLHGGRGQQDTPAHAPTSLTALLSDRIVIVNASGIIVADTADQLTGTAHPWTHISHGAPVVVDSASVGTVLVGSMIDSALTGVSERFLSDITRTLAFSTGIAAALALLLGVILARRVTNPLARLAQAARNVTDGKEFAPLSERGESEIAELSRSFNEMVSEIKRLDAAKRQVIADSAHELRTPVTLIRGMIEGMIDGVYPIDDATLASVHEETLRLSRLIDTLRELEVIESGELRIEPEPIELNDAVGRAANLFAPAADKKGVSLVREPDRAVPCFAMVDRLRIGEVLYNLLSNALKYAPSGGTIRVTVRAHDSMTVGFSIEDSGPGIAESERERVFERFYRVDKSRSADSGGRGLGLAIAKEIVKAHGGAIVAGSSPLGGALLTVTLPRAAPKAAEARN